jgi:hypothetical protein
MDRSWRSWLWLLLSVAGVCSLGLAAVGYLANIIITSTGGSSGGLGSVWLLAGLGLAAIVAGIVGFFRAGAAERRRMRGILEAQ